MTEHSRCGPPYTPIVLNAHVELFAYLEQQGRPGPDQGVRARHHIEHFMRRVTVEDQQARRRSFAAYRELA